MATRQRGDVKGKFWYGEILVTVGDAVLDSDLRALDLAGIEERHHLQTARWEDLAVLIGLFSSLSQARKNGWCGAVSSGYHERLGLSRGWKDLYVLAWDAASELKTRAT